ncbi:cell filamentation protein [Nitrospira sp.]|nr:cell filamentation protein [Nitrospira sp.]
MSDETLPAGVTAGRDMSGLLRPELTTVNARNAAEAERIDEAYVKYVHRARRKKPGSRWLTDEQVRNVHKAMFGSIWDWAGKYRTTRVNIGVEPHKIPEQIQLLCGDFQHWDASSMAVLEVAARLQHRLTWIHPFRNGNGRHARLITDIFLHARGYALPQWPQIQLMAHGEQIRDAYVAAMKLADLGDFGPLAQFIEECLPKTS